MTNKPQHTAGPWIVEERNPCCFDVYNTQNHRRLITTVPNPCKIGNRQIDKANAHLIAAAPEMLEALERMLQWLIDVEESHGEPIPTKYKERVQKAPMIESVKQAIKKAKGE